MRMDGSRKWVESQRSVSKYRTLCIFFQKKVNQRKLYYFSNIQTFWVYQEESYGGYKGQDGFCHIHDANVTLVAPITGWVNVTSGNPNAMKVALLKNGPISVAIDASHKTFSFYSHGVYYDPKW